MRTWRKLLLGALVLSTAAWADTEVEQSCDAAPNGHVRVKNVAGSVQVQTWDRNQVHVKGVLGEDVERLDFAGGGNRVTIEVVIPKRHNRKIASDLTVSIPKGSSLEIETVSAEARVTEVAGKIDAATVSGDLTVERAQGPVHAESISGDVTVSADAPSATVKTTSGRIAFGFMRNDLADEDPIAQEKTPVRRKKCRRSRPVCLEQTLSTRRETALTGRQRCLPLR